MKCSICKTDNVGILYKKEDLTLIKCLACGVVQFDNISEVFDVKTYDYYKDRISLTQEELYNPITTKRYIDWLTRLEHYRKNNALLEVGCGQGQFLSAARKMNWQIKGTEIAPHAVEVCKKFNMDVICRDFLQLDLKYNHYDIVAMFEVLEHLTQPKEYIFKANHVLRKGGILILTTPNFNNLTRLLLQRKWYWIHKEHLFYFTPKTLKKLIRDAHFKILEFKIKDITLPDLYNFFINKDPDKIYNYNQNIRKAVEQNKGLSFFKEAANIFLNITKLGESMQCICQKIEA